ncbi:MAG: DMT family transporter [Gallionellaceae bacterium]|nr:DMT family transporter [Gallionellaceae bacterium]
MLSKQKILSVLGILSGALVWGLMWYPFRVLQNAGVSGQLATFLGYAIALLLGLMVAGPVWREWRLAGRWGMVLMLAAGCTNLGYVLAVLDGEIMRVLLLFYLAPLWTVILSYWLLGEKLNRYGYAIIALSLAGAFAMLWNAEQGMPLPQNRAEWIGMGAGMSFALLNVTVRRVQHLSVNFKSASVWLGTVLFTALLLFDEGNVLVQIRGITADAWILLGLLGLVLCATSLTVQYGLTHLPANQAIILFLSELVFAAVSAYLLAGEQMGMREFIGAALIVVASLLSGKITLGKY